MESKEDTWSSCRIITRERRRSSIAWTSSIIRASQLAQQQLILIPPFFEHRKDNVNSGCTHDTYHNPSSFFLSSKMCVHTGLTNPPQTTVNGVFRFISGAEITAPSVQFHFTFTHFHTSGGSTIYSLTLISHVRTYLARSNFQTPLRLTLQYNRGSASCMLRGVTPCYINI